MTLNKERKLVLCACHKYFCKNKWKPFASIEEALTERFGLDQEAKYRLITRIPLKPGVKRLAEVEAKTGKRVQMLSFPVEVSHCSQCAKKGTQYFEGVLQLRSPTGEVTRFVERELAAQERKGVFVNKVKQCKDGQDLYLTSARFLKVLGRKLQRRFGGDLKISHKLFSRNRQTGRNVYRVNVLFRPPKYKKGDLLRLRGRMVEVVGLGKKVLVRDVKSGRKQSVAYCKL
jgi:nonsense-mediated mRNA decay protein 3